MPVTAYNPISFIDMISFAFRQVKLHLKALFFFAWPVVLIQTILTTITLGLDADFTTAYSKDPHVLFNNPLLAINYLSHLIATGSTNIVTGWFLNYVYFRYVRDSFLGSIKAPLWQYFKPTGELLGWLGMGLMWGIAATVIVTILAGYVFALVMLIALLKAIPILLFLVILVGMLLGIALAVWLVYAAYRLVLTPTCYFFNPAAGLINAVYSSWQLVKRNWWRTFGLIVLIGIICAILMTPFRLIHFATQVCIGDAIPDFRLLEPGLARSTLMFVELFAYFTAYYLVSFTPLLFALGRLALDLAARHEVIITPAEQPK